MLSNPNAHLSDVQSVYAGAEGRLWELIMGEQIHIGGFQSSLDLAMRAQLSAGQQGVDLCCALGAGMRALVRFCKVARMTGVDATPAMLEKAGQRCAQEGLAAQMTFVQADVCATGLPAGQFDFVWGEDAWCYVEDKKRLIAEAARLVRPGGTIAFTDWCEGPTRMTSEEAARYLGFMKFPNVLTLPEYSALLEANGCTVALAEDTGRFPKYVPLYLSMIEQQLTYDALKIINFDTALAGALTGEMRFMQSLAEAGKIIQGILVAKKT
ncbi:MAG: methyltransferase domain-containing protein [Verrucomicrobiota bacterium]